MCLGSSETNASQKWFRAITGQKEGEEKTGYSEIFASNIPNVTKLDHLKEGASEGVVLFQSQSFDQQSRRFSWRTVVTD